MTSFISIQNTYQEIQIALWRDDLCVSSSSVDKIKASQDLIPELVHLLNNNNLTLKDLAFIASNQGPGPFTTLRVVIASVNGLSYATGIPLIGIDGLEAFLKEQSNEQYPQTVALLNAFSQDVYFALQQNNTTIGKGYDNINQFLTTLAKQMPNNQIRFIGNGTTLYQQEIINIFGGRAVIPTPLPETVGIKTIGKIALQTWQHQNAITNQIQPLYLKEFKLGGK